jgi:SAM-dependent methyltransferase
MRPTEEELKALYGEYSYGNDYFISPITISRYRNLFRGFEKYRRTGRLLDVGCGNGLLLSIAREMGWECFGIEVSSAAIKLCREQGLQVFEGTLSEVSDKLPLFDVVVSVEVLEHLNTPAEELRLMNQLIRPGGLLYLTTPNFNGLLRLLTGKDPAIIGYPEHLSYFTPRTLGRLARQTGFQIKNLECTGFSLSVLRSVSQGVAENPVSGASADEKLRMKIESLPIMKAIKRIANILFTITGTGNSLKGWFVKPENGQFR